jgi:polysaccharide biosynthesis transport protein
MILRGAGVDARSNFNKQIGEPFDRERTGLPENSVALSEIVEQLTGLIRRQFPIFVFVVGGALALGFVYLIATPASYTAHAMLLIDSSRMRILQQESPLGDLPIDTVQVESQVEILKSENIALSVIKDLNLSDDPELKERWGLVGKLLDLVVPPTIQSDTGLARRALATFLAKRIITRVSRTYVLDIGYTSLTPTRAALIANAIADAYIVGQLEGKYQATRRASAWLQDRIGELRRQASEADRAVEDYKEKNKIIAVGAGASGAGARLLGEQQLEELNTQLGAARAAAEEARARLERINQVMKEGVPDATVTDSFRSEVINRLRNNYLDIAAKEAIWSKQYGPDHLAAVNLRTQMSELRRSILDELGRIAQGYKSDYEIAKTRVDGLERNLEGLVANSQVTNRDRLGLRDLESTAQVYHTLYNNFLQRYMEAIQQQSFPITEARVIDAAAPPAHKSSPIVLSVLGIAAVLGLFVSLAAAIVREAFNRVFRSKREVAYALKTSCLAILPRLQATGSEPARRAKKDALVSDRKLDSQNTTDPAQELKDPRARMLSATGRFMQVVSEPLSGFAEALRSLKVAVDISSLDRENKVIGITSTLPKEGKSTVACNFSELIADAGKKVILVDGDLRNPALTRALAADAKAGLIEVLAGKVSLEEVIYTDGQTNLSFLPVVIGPRVAHTNEILASAAFTQLLDELRRTHEYIVIDFPPIAPVADVRSVSQVVDSFILVVEWGQTRINLVQHQLVASPELKERLLGVVLNKANVRALERYEPYYGRNYYKSYYGRYGYSG